MTEDFIISELPLVESFYTLQGEGCHAGKPAYFIRLGGCDVCCSFCDTRASWNAKRFPLVTSNEIVARVQKTPAQAVVITGGEPCMHQLDTLTAQLQDSGFACFLETSGSHPITGSWDWICVSPKMNKPPLAEALKQANELKVVIQNIEDINWATENAEQVGDNCLLFLQAEWSVHDQISPFIVEYIKQNPQWNLSVQLHKFISIP